jgi:hypothetical protein
MDDHGETCRPLVRVNYFTGQVLTADDLRAEQDYLRELHRRHIRTCHGWGVVEGLEVASGTGDHGLLVEPGLALSACGDEICVPDRVEIDLAPLATASATAYVAIRASETKVNPVPVVDSADPTAVEWTRVQETFELAVLHALPLSHHHQDEDRSRLQILWWSVRRRLARRQHFEEPQSASTAAEPFDGDWVVLAHVTRTRLASGAENIRLIAGTRRNVR